VRLSMLDAVIALLWSSDMSGYTFIGDDSEREAQQSFIDLIYETADGHISVAVMRRKERESLSRAVGRRNGSRIRGSSIPPGSTLTRTRG
jgi:hypothetical protein